jgi:hypothetical protein
MTHTLHAEEAKITHRTKSKMRVAASSQYAFIDPQLLAKVCHRRKLVRIYIN